MNSGVYMQMLWVCRQTTSKLPSGFVWLPNRGWLTLSSISDWHMNAQGVPHDLQAALYWIKQAADRGDSKAQNSIGIMYANGEGTQRDDRAAAFWFRKAADQGNVRSQHWLSSLYFHGNGVAQDYVQAYYWLCLAEAGSKERGKYSSVQKQIGDALDLVGRHASTEQIAEAKNLARQWKCKTAAQSINEVAFAAARAWRQSDVVLAAFSSLSPDQWQGRKPFAPGEIVFPDPEGAKALLSEANQAIKEGRPSSAIIPLLDDALRLELLPGALDGGVAELRANFYSSAGLHEPQRSHWLYSIGVVFAELKLWREADAVYQAAADLNPTLGLAPQQSGVDDVYCSRCSCPFGAVCGNCRRKGLRDLRLGVLVLHRNARGCLRPRRRLPTGG